MKHQSLKTIWVTIALSLMLKLPSGAISISVTHKDAEMAAKYTNGLMEKIRQLVEIENKDSLEQRLAYLSETLADSSRYG